MELTVHVYLHGEEQARTLAQILAILQSLVTQGNTIMSTLDDLTQTVADLTTAFAPLPAAIDALEAAVTAAKMSPADQAKLDTAVANLRAIAVAVTAAAADATDNVDEGAAPGGTPTP